MASEGFNATILSRRESGNTIYYSTSQGDIYVKVINSDTIDFNGEIYTLLNAYQLIGVVYDRWPDMANYEYLSYFGVSQSDINYFYSHH